MFNVSRAVITRAGSLALAAGVLMFGLHGQAAIAAPAQQAIVPQYYWSYGVKLVCGYQRVLSSTGAAGQGEPVVKPGNYATSINIHNYNYKEVNVRKKVLVLVKDMQAIGREPESVKPAAFDKITLGPDYATMDDCNRIWQLLNPNTALPAIMPLMEGYLVILSQLDLDVDAVYTAEVPGILDQSKDPTGISIDVNRVQGKRVIIPAGALP